MSYTSKKPVESVNTMEALAACVMAFHDNGDTIEKYDQKAWEGSEHSTPLPEVVSNRTRAFAYLAAPESITQAAKDEAQEIINFLQGQMTMNVLMGAKVGDFARDMVNALAEETMPKFKVGLLTYAPHSYALGKLKEAVKEKTVECLYSSQPLGAVGAKVAVNFTMLDKRYIPDYDMFAVYGNDGNGNLVSFLTKHEELAKSGRITGKVKKAENDQWHNNAMVTALNYVKAV